MNIGTQKIRKSIFGGKKTLAGKPDRKKGFKKSKIRFSGIKKPLQPSRTGKRDSENPKVDFRGKKDPCRHAGPEKGIQKISKSFFRDTWALRGFVTERLGKLTWARAGTL